MEPLGNDCHRTSRGPGSLWADLASPLFGAPAGTANMTILDWAKFCALHLRGDPANPNHQANLLTAASFAALHHAEPGRFYQAGWILLKKPWANGHRPGDTGRVISSQGDNGFWHCEAWLAPEIDFALLVICNEGGVTSSKPANIVCRETTQALLKIFGPKNE
ncbi:MAG: serine hydrolase [Nibricoccus sp.]